MEIIRGARGRCRSCYQLTFPGLQKVTFSPGPGDNITFIFQLNEINSQRASDPALLPENYSRAGKSNGVNKGTLISTSEK